MCDEEITLSHARFFSLFFQRHPDKAHLSYMAAAWFRSLLLPAATEREAPKGAILCEGYLWKQKALSHQSWQKRYFFLRTDGLFYSDHPTFSHKMTR
jgi:hypothetical protein